MGSPWCTQIHIHYPEQSTNFPLSGHPAALSLSFLPPFDISAFLYPISCLRTTQTISVPSSPVHFPPHPFWKYQNETSLCLLSASWRFRAWLIFDLEDVCDIYVRSVSRLSADRTLLNHRCENVSSYKLRFHFAIHGSNLTTDKFRVT
jgi:hypothetical protein